MKNNALYFIIPFVLGAAGALIYRSARYQPYAEPEMVPVPAAAQAEAPLEVPDHAAHTTINTICPICGMDVDPSIPPGDYQGKKVGFGCAACPPRFAKDPERWGPAALQNVVAE